MLGNLSTIFEVLEVTGDGWFCEASVFVSIQVSQVLA